jgi:hypothetical protein
MVLKLIHQVLQKKIDKPLITNKTMKTEEIQQRLQDIRMEIHSLDSLRESNDDVNVHIIEEQINELQQEKYNLQDLLDSCFDNLIGL